MSQGIAPDRAKFRLQRVFKAFERVYAVNNRTSYRAVFLVDQRGLSMCYTNRDY